MPARRCDALLDDVGIGAHLKHARIVVALQSQQVHARKRLPGRIGHDTGVGHVAEGVATASALFEPKPVGIDRIVGSAEGTHGQAGQIEPIASVEGLERGADAGHSLAQRRGGREHRLAGAHRRMRPRLRQPAQDTPSPFVWSPWSWVITTARSFSKLNPASSARAKKSRLQMPQSISTPSPVAAFSAMAAFPPLPLASMCSRSIKNFFHLNCH